MSIRKILSLLAFIGVLVLASCTGATFRGGALSKISASKDKVSPTVSEDKPNALFDVSWHQKLWPYKQKPARAPSSFVADVIATAQESNLFGKVSTDSVSMENYDYKIEIDMLNHGNWLAAYLMGTISGLTLMTVPAYARDNYTLTATVYGPENIKKEYLLNDYIFTVFHIILLPVTPFTKHTGDLVRQNMLRHLFKNMGTDNIIKPKGNQLKVEELEESKNEETENLKVAE